MVRILSQATTPQFLFLTLHSLSAIVTTLAKVLRNHWISSIFFPIVVARHCLCLLLLYCRPGPPPGNSLRFLRLGSSCLTTSGSAIHLYVPKSTSRLLVSHCTHLRKCSASTLTVFTTSRRTIRTIHQVLRLVWTSRQQSRLSKWDLAGLAHQTPNERALFSAQVLASIPLCGSHISSTLRKPRSTCSNTS